MSVCVRALNPPAPDLYANQRDIDGLDFTALTDHGFNMNDDIWAYTGEQARNTYDPEQFVSLLGLEWTSERYGHRNLVYADPHHHEHYRSDKGIQEPRKLWQHIAAAGGDFICIPHQIADHQYGRETDWQQVHEHHQPLAEIFQARQSYEYLGCPRQAPKGSPSKGHYIQDVWAHGVVIGVIASPDHGGTTGRAGVWATGLTRKELFDAFHARHTFGTSGAKMSVFFAAGDAMMGDKAARRAGPISFTMSAVTLKPIKEIVIFRNNKIVYTASPAANAFRATWTDGAPPDVPRLWYYMRVQREDEELAWTSPIWFEKE
jgi:hypothetical protein